MGEGWGKEGLLNSVAIFNQTWLRHAGPLRVVMLQALSPLMAVQAKAKV